MTDPFDRDPFDSLELRRAVELETKRLRYAAERIADHAKRELVLLERAAHADDDDAARMLEYEAGTAHRDSIALTEEHGLDR
jgi:hypothetical protein